MTNGEQWWRQLSDEEREAAVKNMQETFRRVQTYRTIPLSTTEPEEDNNE